MIKNVIIEITIPKMSKGISAIGDIPAFLRERITSISYDLDARENKADMLTLTFIDTNTYDISKLLREGTEIDVRFGYYEESLTVAEMTINSVETNFNENGTATVSVMGLGKGIPSLDTGIVKKTWVKADNEKEIMTLTKIVKEIAKKHGLRAVMSDETLTDEVKFDKIQQKETDYNFLKKLAKEHGFTCDIGKREIYFTHRKDKTEKVKEDKSIVALGYKCNIGLPLLHFNARIDTKEIGTEISSTFVNPKGKQEKKDKSAKVPSDEQKGSLTKAYKYKEGKDGKSKMTEIKKETDEPKSVMERVVDFAKDAGKKAKDWLGLNIDETTDKDIEKEIEALLKESGISLEEIMGSPGGTDEHMDTVIRSLQRQNPKDATASGSTLGTNRLIKGSLIEIHGVGRWSGTWRLDRVNHIVDTSGYKVNFDCSSDSFLTSAAAKKFKAEAGKKEKKREEEKNKVDETQKGYTFETKDKKSGSKIVEVEIRDRKIIKKKPPPQKGTSLPRGTGILHRIEK